MTFCGRAFQTRSAFAQASSFAEASIFAKATPDRTADKLADEGGRGHLDTDAVAAGFQSCDQSGDGVAERIKYRVGDGPQPRWQRRGRGQWRALENWLDLCCIPCREGTVKDAVAIRRLADEQMRLSRNWVSYPYRLRAAVTAAVLYWVLDDDANHWLAELDVSSLAKRIESHLAELDTQSPHRVG